MIGLGGGKSGKNLEVDLQMDLVSTLSPMSDNIVSGAPYATGGSRRLSLEVDSYSWVPTHVARCYV